MWGFPVTARRRRHRMEKGGGCVEILKSFANLIKVKTLVTLAVMTVFCTLAVRGEITSDNVMIVVSTVIAFYFGTQHEKS